jgi:regulator of replication initiation timing
VFILSPEEASSIRETVKRVAEERDTVKKRLERCETALHLLRIENDKLRKELLNALKK